MATSGQQWGFGLPDQAHQPERSAAPPRPAALAQRLAALRGDVLGGVTAAVLTVPVSMGYGLLALAPLGDSFTATAILAGLLAPILGCVTAVLLGANTTIIYSPRSIVTFLIGSLVLHSLLRSSVPELAALTPGMVLVLAFLMVFLAGAFQALFGVLRWGSLVKYIPAPVIAGFQNAAAILIFASQLNAMLGLKQGVPLLNLELHAGALQPLTLGLGILTCWLILRGARITKKVPPTLLGLIGGVLTYHLLAGLGLGGLLGPTIGAIPFSWPTPDYLPQFLEIATGPLIIAVLPTLIAGALSLAIVASLDGLLCGRLVQADSGNRIQGNGELIRLGVGNMVAASFGGIANGINLGSSFANHRSGARTPVSVLVHAAAIFLMVLLFSELITYLPRVVVAAMLVVVAIQLFDRWTWQILKKIFAGDFARVKGVLLDFLIILLVTVVAITTNIVFAVILGVAVTILFFLFRMSKSIVRRAFRCDVVHSRKTRDPKLMSVLSSHGGNILVLELEGALFFGTAENLALYLEDAWRDNVNYVIIDLKRVNEVDSTGARILLQAHDSLTKNGKYLLLSSLADRTQISAFLNDMGVTAALTRGRQFSDLDRAIEWAEDHLILAKLGDTEAGVEFPFGRLDVFANMNDDELAIIKNALDRRAYRKGEVIFREGDSSDELYVIAKGTASVRLRLAGTDRETRLITFAPGTVFGEIALLDQETRSATVEADDDLVCYVLTREQYTRLVAQHAAIAVKLLTNLGRELSGRLRRANRTIYQLAS